MDLLQNAVIIVSGFLLSEMLVATGMHNRLIGFLLRHSGSNLSALLTAILLISYALSVFLSNTIVVVSMIPVINRLLSPLLDRPEKKTVASFFYLSLTFGAATGGVASLTGSPLNMFALGLAELYRLEGRGSITFFSWLGVGLPASLILLYCGRAVILFTAKSFKAPMLFSIRREDDAALPHKPLLFLICNILLVTVLTGCQFFFRPEPVLFRLNIIDLCFLFYGSAWIAGVFILPKNKVNMRALFMNALFLALYLFSFPLLFISHLCRELESRTGFHLKSIYRFIDSGLLRIFNTIWKWCFREPFISLETPNCNTLLSINTIIRDIPSFGLFLLTLTGGILFAVVNAGNNPATPEIDGYLLSAAKSAIVDAVAPFDNTFLLLLALVIVVMFASELLSNTALVIMLSPMVTSLAAKTALSPVILLLTITIASSCAFMTPLASSSSTLAFGGIEKVSLKTILIPGFFMNLAAGFLSAIIFSALSLML